MSFLCHLVLWQDSGRVPSLFFGSDVESDYVEGLSFHSPFFVSCENHHRVRTLYVINGDSYGATAVGDL